MTCGLLASASTFRSKAEDVPADSKQEEQAEAGPSNAADDDVEETEVDEGKQSYSLLDIIDHTVPRKTRFLSMFTDFPFFEKRAN